jgi:hypothetical protein
MKEKDAPPKTKKSKETVEHEEKTQDTVITISEPEAHHQVHNNMEGSHPTMAR